MKLKLSHTLILLFLGSLAMPSCKKEEDLPPPVVDEPKPIAAFEYKQVSEDDPFTFQFTNGSKDFKEVRWEFGDDTTTTDLSPLHTYIDTGIYRVRMIATNGQGYWAQRETRIRLIPDSILSFDARPGAAGQITLFNNSNLRTESLEWLKGTGTNQTVVSTENTATVSVANDVFDTYTLRATTPKGSKVQVHALVSTLGVVRDVTTKGFYSVSRDNNSGPASKEGSPKLIDNNINTKFLQFDFKDYLWCQIDYDQDPVSVGAYTLTSGDDAIGRDPKDWRFEASNNGTDWTVLDVRTGESFPTRKLTKTFIFDNRTPYRFYRLYITSTVSAGLIQISEWRLLQVP